MILQPRLANLFSRISNKFIDKNSGCLYFTNMPFMVPLVLNVILFTGRALHGKSFLAYDFILGLFLVNIISFLLLLTLKKKEAWSSRKLEIITIGCSLLAFILYRQIMHGLSFQSLMIFSIVLYATSGVLYLTLLLFKSLHHRITYRSNTYGRDALPH